MQSVFSRIIAGELPARFVWKDRRCVAFLTTAPLRPGHVLVVPREEVDHWVDASPELLAHLMQVAQKIAKGIDAAWHPTKVGLIIAGLEVRHLHVHLTPIWALSDLDFARQDKSAKPDDLDDAAERLRAALREQGHAEVDA
jgi:diadenosine tetraphosphate (Ap4A) HIT family hydrolase